LNILVDTLPESVTIDGREHPVNCDFRTCLRTIMAFEDNNLTPQEKAMILLGNIYPNMPENAQDAVAKANWFLNGGETGEADDQGESAPAMRLYSFEKDAGFIFAAFRQTHGIDLQKIELHWWEFLALFMDLGSETTFVQLVNLRKRIKTGKASKEERQAAREMGEMLELEEVDNRTLEDKVKEAEFLRLVQGN
jgi:hypothetical protein